LPVLRSSYPVYAIDYWCKKITFSKLTWLANAADKFNARFGHYPSDVIEFIDYLEADGIAFWGFEDEWGRQIHYLPKGESKPEIWSDGPPHSGPEGKITVN
jgi:hypothetical protein